MNEITDEEKEFEKELEKGIEKKAEEDLKDVKKKTPYVFLSIIALLIAISILGIIYFKGMDENNLTESEISCIQNKLTMFTLPTCGNCAKQKDILGKYSPGFNIIQCVQDLDLDLCLEKGISHVPTWLNKDTGEKTSGVKTWDELNTFAGCNETNGN